MTQVLSRTGTSTGTQKQSPTLPALSILQPWPHMIFHHHKRIENRMWTTNYRGPILIHTGKSKRLTEPAYSQLITEELRGRGYLDCPFVGGFDIQRHLVFGALVGVAYLAWCTKYRAEAIRKAAEFNPDCPLSQEIYADPEAEAFFVFAQVAKFVEPIAYSGARGIFDVPMEVVSEQLAKLNWRIST